MYLATIPSGDPVRCGQEDGDVVPEDGFEDAHAHEEEDGGDDMEEEKDPCVRALMVVVAHLLLVEHENQYEDKEVKKEREIEERRKRSSAYRGAGGRTKRVWCRRGETNEFFGEQEEVREVEVDVAYVRNQ